MTQITSEHDVFQSRADARDALDQVRRELLAARTVDGHWTGELAASALSTATAVSAFAAVLLNQAAEDAESGRMRELVRRGMDYLRDQQNADGGFGDTDRSHSNIATSYLVLSASTLAERLGESPLDSAAVSDLTDYLDRAGNLDGLRRRYGKDKTFVVPIMNNMAIAGLISWDDVAALPFEAAVFPQSMYRFLQMPVVSYAIPALVAIGQARHFLGRRTFLPLRLLRAASVKRTLKVLRRMQPQSGGYLEATPLTSFVVMSLAATGRTELSVVQHGLRFLFDSVREDGSWPIDTNLATWVTSLSIHALACDPEDDGAWYSDDLAYWHLDCQHLSRHPFTGAEPGGWGWTDLSGAVPDSDDTPAAILATAVMRKHADEPIRKRQDRATALGMNWLKRLQNRDGGWPTFCRGWGKLPFDRSSTDLTAHALRVWETHRAMEARPEYRKARRRGERFLKSNQAADGSWLPLWFGNQDLDDESNPVYGTSRVLIAGAVDEESSAAAVQYLLDCQNPDGGWGGGASVPEKLRETAQRRGEPLGIPEGLSSTVEETALVVEALATVVLRQRAEKAAIAGNSDAPRSVDGFGGFNEPVPVSGGANSAAGNERFQAAILRGVEFLAQSVEDRRHRVPWPIGFYFAKLWYHEQLYPLIFTTAALGKFLRATEASYDDDWPR